MMGSVDCRTSSSMGFSRKKSGGHGSPLVSVMPARKEREKEVQMQLQLQERVKGLEQERSKIEAFKRELPLCMELLNDAIEASKERLATHMPSLLKVRSDLQGEAMVGPVKRHSTEDAAAPSKRREEEEEHISKNQAAIVLQDIRDNVVGWEIPKLVSQQENLGNEGVALPEKTSSNILRALLEHPFGSTAKPFVNSKPKLGGAFSPFQREKQAPQPVPQSDPVKTLPGHSLLSSSNREVDCTGKCEGKLCHVPEMKKGKLKDAATLDPKSKEGALAEVIKTAALTTSSDQAEVGQPQKKTRRCWSPELHHRFVNALQQLGGPQVATPKQIRELMNVEGLTNDEVKSHLQKYRLHARRCSPTPTTLTASVAPQLVLLGGIWAASSEYSQQSQTPALFNSNPHPHLCQVAIPPQDYYGQQVNNPLHPPMFYEQSQPSPTLVEGRLGEHSLASSAEVAIREESADGNSENSESSAWKVMKKRTRQSQWSGEDSQKEEEEEVTNTQESCHSLSSSTSQKCLVWQ